MTLAIRFVPATGRAVLTANGRSYPVGGATTVDVPYPDALAIVGQGTPLMIVGATTDRPTYNPGAVGGGMPAMMYDTTLGEAIFYVLGSNPPKWIDISGAAA